MRRHAGQIETADALRALMAGSAIRASHLVDDVRVQDPYCLRCQPQVMGAALDLLRQQAATLETEANGVSDNPLIFPETAEALSGGNFHAEPVAFAADIIALALCEIGSIAERRLAMITDPGLSGLPAFLTHGARRLLPMAQNLAAIIAIELLAAAQGCDFHAPLLSSPALERVRVRLRHDVPHLEDDRFFAPDIAAAVALVTDGTVASAADVSLPGLAA